VHRPITPTTTLKPAAAIVEKRALAHSIRASGATYAHTEKVHGVSHGLVTRWAKKDSFDDAPRLGRSLDEETKIDRVAAILATHSIRGASLLTG
jgi:hypothetical protein